MNCGLPPARKRCGHVMSFWEQDETYVNGVRVGGMGWENPNAWCTPREYEIPSDLTRETHPLRIAVRVRSHQYHGGMTGPVSLMKIYPGEDETSARSLAGDWSFVIEQNWGTVTPPPPSIATFLFQ